MAWLNLPTSPSTIIDWDFRFQFYMQLRGRHRAIGTGVWPPVSTIWDSGQLESITDNGNGTLTANFSNVNWAPAAGASSDRWVDYVEPDVCYVPSTYDLIIEGDDTDPFTTIRMTITGMTWDSSTLLGTLTFSDKAIKNAQVGGLIPSSLGALSGWNYYLVRSGDDWWTDRVPTKPNDPEQWIGSMVAGGIDESNNGYVQEEMNLFNPDPYDQPNNPTVAWQINQFVGMQCLAIDANGYLHRLTITSNDAQHLYFGSLTNSTVSNFNLNNFHQTLALSGGYTIVTAGNRGIPGRRASYFQQWYGGLGTAIQSHMPDDSIGSINIPALVTSWAEGDPDADIPCVETEQTTVMDADVQIETTNPCECARAGKYLARDLYMTVRGLQNDVLTLLPSFIDPNFTAGSFGTAATAPNPLYPAVAFQEAGINAWTANGSYNDSGSVQLDNVGPAPYFPISVYFTRVGIEGYAGLFTQNGVGTLSADGILSGASIVDDGNSREFILSLGWDRFYPRTFQYLYGMTICIPDSDAATQAIYDPPAIVDYPTSGCLGAGRTWIYRGPSANYVERTSLGLIGTGEAFQTGDLARYVGDNSPDGFTGRGVVTTPPPFDAQLWDRFFRGKYSKPVQSQRVESQIGTITAAGTYYVEDNAQAWWTDAAGNVGTARIQSNPIIAGTTTTLSIAAPSGQGACWLAAGGFNGSTIYGQFILEIYKGGLPAGWTVAADGTASYSTPAHPTTPTVFKVPILSGVLNNGVITFAFAPVAGLSVATSDAMLIREPRYELNKWQGRTLTIATSGGVSVTVPILYSDYTRLYFSPNAITNSQILSSGIQPGWFYAINEIGFGSVLQWNGAAWIVPTGTDSRTGKTFSKNLTAIAPTKVHDYGLSMIGDYLGGYQWNQLYNMIALMKRVAYTGNWDSRGEQNYVSYYGGDDECDYRFGTPGSTAAYENWWNKTIAYSSDLSSASVAPQLIKSANCSGPCPSGVPYSVVFAATDPTQSYAYFDGNLSSYWNNLAVNFYAIGAYPIGAPTPNPPYTVTSFQADGAPIQLGVWSEWGSATTDDDNNWLSPMFGTIEDFETPPSPPVQPYNPGTGGSFSSSNWSGFSVAGAFALVDYSQVFQDI